MAIVLVLVGSVVLMVFVPDITVLGGLVIVAVRVVSWITETVEIGAVTVVVTLATIGAWTYIVGASGERFAASRAI